MTDSEYLLSLLDETFAAVPQIKAHHERMRQIAARLATNPLAAAVPQQEANLSAVQQPRCPVCLASFPCQHSLTSTTAGWATTPQVSPPPARVPLTEAQTQHLFDTHVGSPSERYPLGRDDFSHFATAIQRTCADAWGVTLSEGERSHD